MPNFLGWIFFSCFIQKDLSLSIYRWPKNWARTLGLASNDGKFLRDNSFTKKIGKKLEIFWGYYWFLTIIAKIQTVNHFKNHSNLPKNNKIIWKKVEETKSLRSFWVLQRKTDFPLFYEAFEKVAAFLGQNGTTHEIDW